MKHFYKNLLAAAMLIIGLDAFAYSFENGGLYYNILSTQDMTCEVTQKATGSYVGEIVIPETVVNDGKTYKVTAVGYRAFKGSGVKSVKIGDNVETIGSVAFYYCREMETVQLGKNLRVLGSQAFYNCNVLTSVEMGDSVTEIKDNAFYDCRELSELKIGKNVKTIGVAAFGNCSNLTSVVIPDSVTEIKDNVFYYCSKLTSVTIGKSVKNICPISFYMCEALTDIEMLNPEVPALAANAFIEKTYKKATLTVPVGSLNAYKQAENWKNFASIWESGVETAVSDGVRVFAAGKTITVSGAKPGTPVEIYNITGQLEQRGFGCEFEAAHAGIYIVRAAGRTFKVAVM